MKREYCPVCGSESEFSFCTKYVKVHNCNNQNCDHYFAIEIQYDQGVCQYDMNKNYNIYNERNKKLIKYWESMGFINNKIRLLDVGTGFGHLLDCIQHTFPKISITCVEPSSSYKKVLNEKGYTVYNNIVDVPIEKYDSILMIEVIEHLHDPVHLLSEVHKRLKKSGRLFLTTPAGNVSPKIKKPTFFEAYNNPTHIQFFTEKSLKYALSNTGFKKVKYRYVPSLYVSQPNVAFTRLWQIARKYYLHYRGQTTHLTYIAS